MNASIPAPLPSNELGVNGLLRNGLPCKSKLTPVLLVMKRVFAKVIAPKVFMFAPTLLLANRQLSTYSQLSVLTAPKCAFSIVQYSKRQPVVEFVAKSKPSQSCPFKPAEDDRGIGKSFQNAMPRRSETQCGIGIGRFDNDTGIDCEIAAWQIGGGLSKPIRQA